MTTDFTFADHGSVCLLRPVTLNATAWVAEHIPDDSLWFGGAVVIEPRYVSPILDGIAEEGFSVGPA